MMRKAPVPLFLLLAATGCATVSAEEPPRAPGVPYARIGQSVYVEGPRVTPLAVVEDSRCPEGVQCVWAGRVRISARIDLGARSETRELTLHKPEQVADGSLELIEVRPARKRDTAIPNADYRFAFRFMGGL